MNFNPDFSKNDDFFAPTGAANLIKSKIHIRVQQRNGRKCITTIDGLDDDLDLKRICRYMRKTFNCNGNVFVDEDHPNGIIQLQGDQRDNSRDFLIQQEVVLEPDRIVIHGF